MRYDALKQSRRWSLDLNPHVMYAAGETVNLMVSSGVSNYLEFRSMDALCVLEPADTPPPAAAAEVEAEAEEASPPPAPSRLMRQDTSGAKPPLPAPPPPTKLWRVPCGKKDIFQSNALSAGEKRQLMKLLRFCVDWGNTTLAGADLAALNDKEETLAQGRALNRPQNKGAVSKSFGGWVGGGGGGGGGPLPPSATRRASGPSRTPPHALRGVDETGHSVSEPGADVRRCGVDFDENRPIATQPSPAPLSPLILSQTSRLSLTRTVRSASSSPHGNYRPA